MGSAQQYLEASEDEALAELAASIEENPLCIIELATAIGANRGLQPTSQVTAIAQKFAAKLEEADGSELLDAVTECLMTRDVDAALEWLLGIGFVTAYLPEVAATKDLTQEGGRKHKDVWEHTKLVVRQAVKRPAVRWGALLHDIGKVPTRRFTKNGVHFHGHAEVGARMFDKIGRRIPFERSQRRHIRFLIKHHLRSAQYHRSWSDSAVRRFGREMEVHLVDLLDLSRADITSKRPGKRQSLLRQISQLSDRVDALREQDAIEPPLKPGIGNAIMEHFSLPPSRLIGDIKKRIEAAIESGELEERREDDYYIKWLEAEDVIAQVQPGSS